MSQKRKSGVILLWKVSYSHLPRHLQKWKAHHLILRRADQDSFSIRRKKFLNSKPGLKPMPTQRSLYFKHMQTFWTAAQLDEIGKSLNCSRHICNCYHWWPVSQQTTSNGAVAQKLVEERKSKRKERKTQEHFKSVFKIGVTQPKKENASVFTDHWLKINVLIVCIISDDSSKVPTSH